jgi:hypothetical protein
MMMGMKRRGLLALAAIGCGALACNALIGTKDLFFQDDGGGGSSGDGGGGGGGGDTGVPPGSDGGGPPSDAPVTGDTGQCGDTQKSADNCGRCGHSCLGGTCDAGQCQPVTLAANISPRDLAVDAKHVYWIEPSTARAMQADKDGANPIQLGGGTSNYLTGLDIDDASAFWGTRDELLLRCKIGGCANTPAIVTSQITYMGDLAVDDTNGYWLQDTDPATIKKAAKGGTNGAATQLVAETGDAGSYHHIATDGQYVYWTADDGKVRRIAVGGGAVTVVASATGSAGGLAVDEQNVYFTAGDDPGTVNYAPKGGTSGGSALAAAQHLPIAVAVDANSIYWVNSAIGISETSGTVMTCRIASCTPTTLASAQRTPVSIAVDDTAVYWSNFDLGNSQGGIMKVAKP